MALSPDNLHVLDIIHFRKPRTITTNDVRIMITRTGLYAPRHFPRVSADSTIQQITQHCFDDRRDSSGKLIASCADFFALGDTLREIRDLPETFGRPDLTRP